MRISSRAIIFDKDIVYLLFRRKRQSDGTFKEYYVLPGGGVLENETLHQTLIREIKEELCVDIEIEGYVGTISFDNSVAYYYRTKIIDGIPRLGGEEKERNISNNYYEIVKTKVSNLSLLDKDLREIIIKAYNKEYLKEQK